MTQPHAAAASFITQTIPSAVMMAPVLPNLGAEEALSLLQYETSCAVILFRSVRDRASGDAKADLKAAFNHIDKALPHSELLRRQVDARVASDLTLLHRSMQYFQAVLSDIPQISFMNNAMIDSFHAIKDALIETRQILEAVEL